MENYSKRRFYLNKRTQNNSYISPYKEDTNYNNMKLEVNLNNNNKKYIDINKKYLEIQKNLNCKNYLENTDNIKDNSIINLKKKNNTYFKVPNNINLNNSQNIKTRNTDSFISPLTKYNKQNKTNVNMENQRYYNYLNKKQNYNSVLQNSYDNPKFIINSHINYYNEPKYKDKKININNYDYRKIFKNQTYDSTKDLYSNNNNNKKSYRVKYPVMVVDQNKRYKFSTHSKLDETKLIIKIQSAWRGYYLRKIAVGSIKKYIRFIALVKFLEKIIKNEKKDFFDELIKLLKKPTDEKKFKYRYRRIKKNNDINNIQRNNNDNTNNNNRRYRNFNNSNKNDKNNSNVEKIMFKNVYNFKNVEFEPLRDSKNNSKRNSEEKNNDNDKKGVIIYFINKEKEKEREREKEQRKKEQINREKENEKRRLEKEQRKKEQIEREKENEKRRIEKIKVENERKEKEKKEKELKEKLEKERKEKELKEKMENERKEKELKEKLEREKNEKESKEKIGKEKKEKELKEKREKELREKREKDFKERLEKIKRENEKREKEKKEREKQSQKSKNNIEKNTNNKINNGINNNATNDDDIFSKPIKIIYVPKIVTGFNNVKHNTRYYFKRLTRDRKEKIEKLKKYIYKKCYEINYPILLHELKAIHNSYLNKLKQTSLNNIFKLLQKKHLKKYLKIYRESVLNEKVKEEIIKKNMNLFKINKEKEKEGKNNDIILLEKKNENIYDNINEINDVIIEDNNENEEDINTIENKNEAKIENKNEDKIILRGKRKYLSVNNRFLLLNNIINKKINLEKKNNIDKLNKYFKYWNKYIRAYADDSKKTININLHSPDIEIRGNKSKKKHIRVKFTKAITSKTSIGSIKSEGKSNSSSIQTKKMRIKNIVVNPHEYLATTLLNNQVYNNTNIKYKRYLKILLIMDKIDNKSMKYKCFKYWKNNK